MDSIEKPMILSPSPSSHAAYHPARTVKPPAEGSYVTAHASRRCSSSCNCSCSSSPSNSKPSRNAAMAFRLSPEPFAPPPPGFPERPMMKKRPSSPSSSLRHRLRLGSKIVVSFAVFLFIFALLRLHSRSSTSSFEALSLRRRISDPFVGPPKIAFLFLTRTTLPLDFLWQNFFQHADKRTFSVYIHSKPGFVFDESTTRCPLFYGRQLSRSIEVVWGESSMIEAEKLLLEEALEDPANQRFVLLSDSFLDKKGGRYNPKMLPIIPKRKWRKGSQWITLVRKHAEVVVDDDIVFPVFKKYCKRRPPLDLEGKQKPISIGWLGKVGRDLWRESHISVELSVATVRNLLHSLSTNPKLDTQELLVGPHAWPLSGCETYTTPPHPRSLVYCGINISLVKAQTYLGIVYFAWSLELP
ncbi:hypothetical protein ACLOJK_037505 [Asimina triloba]